MREGAVQANGVRFAYLEEGEGPLVLLLHGYPDGAHTWSHLIPELAAAGYRAVAPWTRGYPPTDIPSSGFFDSGTLATDARELIRVLGGEPAFVVGHDWGAAATWYLVSAYPESVRRAAILSIPHPAVIAGTFADPAAIRSVFHWWFFQMPGLPEAAIPANDFAMIDYLWKLWSPNLDDPEHVARVKQSMAAPGAVEATLGYYRAMFDESRADPALAHVRGALGQPIQVPVLSVIGDGEVVRAENGRASGTFVEAEFRFEQVANAGHFAHRERPAEVAKLVLDWFASA